MRARQQNIWLTLHAIIAITFLRDPFELTRSIAISLHILIHLHHLFRLLFQGSLRLFFETKLDHSSYASTTSILATYNILFTKSFYQTYY